MQLQECQTIWSFLVVICTFDTFFELTVLFLRCSLTSSSGLKESGICIAVSFIIPLHCLKLATSPSDLPNSNSVLSMPPVLESHHVWHWVFSETNFKISYCCLSLLTSVAQMHKLGLLTSYDCDG